MLELLRRRALQMDVVAAAVPERRHHRLRRAGIDRVQAGVVHALLVQRVFEHRERLAAVVGEHARRLRACCQAKSGSARRPAMKKPSRWLIWAKCTISERSPRSSGAQLADGRRLDQIEAAVLEPLARDLARPGDRELGFQPLGGEKAARLGRDQRAVERGVAREHDPDLRHVDLQRARVVVGGRGHARERRARPATAAGSPAATFLDPARRILSRREWQAVDAAVDPMESPDAASRSLPPCDPLPANFGPGIVRGFFLTFGWPRAARRAKLSPGRQGGRGDAALRLLAQLGGVSGADRAELQGARLRAGRGRPARRRAACARVPRAQSAGPRAGARGRRRAAHPVPADPQLSRGALPGASAAAEGPARARASRARSRWRSPARSTR